MKLNLKEIKALLAVDPQYLTCETQNLLIESHNEMVTVLEDALMVIDLYRNGGDLVDMRYVIDLMDEFLERV